MAASLAFTAELILRLGVAPVRVPAFLSPAQRRFTPARMLARPCADIFRRPGGRRVGASALRSWESSAWSASMRSWMSAARRNAAGEAASKLFTLAEFADTGAEVKWGLGRCGCPEGISFGPGIGLGEDRKKKIADGSVLARRQDTSLVFRQVYGLASQMLAFASARSLNHRKDASSSAVCMSWSGLKTYRYPWRAK